MAAATVATAANGTIRPGTDTETRPASVLPHNTSGPPATSAHARSGSVIVRQPVTLSLEEILVVGDHDNPLVPRADDLEVTEVGLAHVQFGADLAERPPSDQPVARIAAAVPRRWNSPATTAVSPLTWPATLSVRFIR